MEDNFDFIGFDQTMSAKILATELDIVWLEDCQGLPYVRESLHDMARRRKSRTPSFRAHDGRLVAYAVLKPDTPSNANNLFMRRYWWIATHDHYDGGPREAVDPRSVKAGKYSQRPGVV